MAFDFDRLVSHRAALVLLVICIISLIIQLVWPSARALSAISLILVAADMLLASILHWRRFRQRPGMWLFHIALAVLIIGFVMAPLLQAKGYFELAEGQTFKGGFIFFHTGAFGPGSPPRWQLLQGPITAHYTRATIGHRIESSLTDQRQQQQLPIRFLEAVMLNGYRIEPTGNMGYAAVLSYRAPDGTVQRGVVNFPAYPNLRNKQKNQFYQPADRWIAAELVMPNPPYRQNRPWSLELPSVYHLKLRYNKQTFKLRPGKEIKLGKGRLRLDGLVRWLGYVVNRDPTAPLMFVAGLVCLLGLGCHWLAVRKPEENSSHG